MHTKTHAGRGDEALSVQLHVSLTRSVVVRCACRRKGQYFIALEPNGGLFFHREVKTLYPTLFTHSCLYPHEHPFVTTDDRRV